VLVTSCAANVLTTASARPSSFGTSDLSKGQ
jgi:hypothetical protein